MSSESYRHLDIMVVDDSEMDNLLNKIILEKVQFSQHIHVYQDPEMAISDLQNQVCKPEIIFIDINMPQMSGFEFIEAVEKLEIPKFKPKFYIISSSDDQDDIIKAQKYKSVHRYIKKPLDPSDL
ncbi:MAG: response regulator [Cytophagaceae bacterium]